MLEQAYNLLSLKNGWVNKVFGQKKEVFQLSDSYNYAFSRTASGGQTWLVSGITSPSEADQTLVGFMMVDIRTKKALRYPMSGITEMRALEIAEFLLAGDSRNRYSADIGLSNATRFMQIGDSVEFTCLESSAGDGTRYVTALVNRSLEK